MSLHRRVKFTTSPREQRPWTSPMRFIITAPGAQPNPAWLSFVITGKARGGIRHTLKNQKSSESIELGRRLLERSLGTQSKSFVDVTEAQWNRVLALKNISDVSDLLEAIGLGNQMAFVITRSLLEDNAEQYNEPDQHAPLAIRGTEGLVVTYAKCCKPIPGDPIIGHISPGKGIVVHVDGCRNMYEFRDRPEEIMTVRWDPNVDDDFSVELRVELEHEKAMIATLASIITNADANIERMNMVERDAALSTVNIVLSVRDRVHLAAVIKRLRTVRSINRSQ